ncbi:hypothetical protein QJS04_geneDACA021964 [Acorus gramineus]|uniref:Uncharacterized protein n=1 Tax=Acorus gramineus TaxID=55184 RepID=A0AAV9AAL4_ACOGR|nr:hypothetical protein QJS04_geneDACA021964 [Acorus gramineus]
MNLPNKKMSAMEEIKLLEKENLDRLRLLEERLKNLEKAEPEFQRLQKGKNPIIAPDQPLSLELSLSQIDGGRVRKRARQEFINGRDFLGLNIGGVGAVDSRVISDQTVGIAGPLGDPNLDLSLKISLTGEPKGSDDVRFPPRDEV